MSDEDYTVRFQNLAALCQEIDAVPHLIDVQCAEDELLIKRWRAAFQSTPELGL